MVKASPHVRSFNAGEISELLEGRTDIERYPSSLRRLFNYIAAPQGPAVCRSGTAFVAPVTDHDEVSVLVPFVFSNEQAKLLEFGADRIRFLDEDGLQVYEPVVATVTSGAGVAITFTSSALGGIVGEEIVLLGLPAEYNMNGEVARITAKVGTTYTLDVGFAVGVTPVNFDAALVYHVPCVYTQAQRESIRYVQSVDVMYLLCGTKRTRKLSRYDTYDWRLEDVKFKDGPYLPVNDTATTMKPLSTGNVIENNTPSPWVPSASGNRPAISADGEWLGRTIPNALYGSQSYYAFSRDDSVSWCADTAQVGYLQIHNPTAFTVDGYTVYAPRDNDDTQYLSKEFAPSSWTFEGNVGGGAPWVVLDRQEEYVLYDNGKSVFFELKNETPYAYYRINITKLVANGPIEPRIRRLTMRTEASSIITIDASSTVGINKDQGFKTSDVGRLLRIKGNDNAWRACEIVAYSTPTQVNVKLLDEPFLDVETTREWRLGYWSDTTGWPSVGDFFEDRLFLAACDEYPDMFASSMTGSYEAFSPTDTFGEVLDDNSVYGRLNSRKLSRIRWLSSDDKGLLMGTGSEEYSLTAPNGEVMTARNAKARPATRRGSADVEPVRVDSQVLYVQRSGRAIREFAYVFEADGYRSPSMSQLASHLGAQPFVEMDYAAEPHSIVWIRRADGSLIGLTYNRDEGVVGWHRHDLSGGVIEALAVVPQKDQLQDALWLSIRRTIDGQTRRYIERLTRFWDFDTEIEDAHFVDCGLRYVGDETDTVYGLQHLEGEDVYGLADGRPFGPVPVINGTIVLESPASNIVVGLGYDSEGETSRLENGAADGTAMGKPKRIHRIVPHVWRSFGGEFGVYNTELKGPSYDPVEYPGNLSEFEDIELYTGECGPITPSKGYEPRGSLFFRRPKASPLPFNVVAIMPQLVTQDGG